MHPMWELELFLAKKEHSLLSLVKSLTMKSGSIPHMTKISMPSFELSVIGITTCRLRSLCSIQIMKH